MSQTSPAVEFNSSIGANIGDNVLLPLGDERRLRFYVTHPGKWEISIKEVSGKTCLYLERLS
jgi:hypothetical protein